MDLSFLRKSVSAQMSLVETNMNLNVLGGKWKLDLKSDNATATMDDAVQQWVGSVQSSANLAVLTHTTVPITALLPSKMHSKIEARVKYVTSRWMHSITVLETALFLKKKVNTARQSFEATWKLNAKVDSLSEIVNSLGEFCATTNEYNALENSGYIDRSSTSLSPASLSRYCRETLLWTCQVAAPQVDVDADLSQLSRGHFDAGLWQLFMLPDPETKQLLLQATSTLCTQLDKKDY